MNNDNDSKFAQHEQKILKGDKFTDIDLFEKEQEAYCELRENEARQIFSQNIKIICLFSNFGWRTLNVIVIRNRSNQKFENKQMILEFGGRKSD